MICVWAAPPTCMSRGLRAYPGVYAHTQGLTRERHPTTGTVAPKTQTTSPLVARCQRFSPRWSETWALHHLEQRLRRRQSGGNCAMQGCDTPTTRRKRASHGAKPPPATGMENTSGPGRPGPSAHEQQGAAIARQLARGLRQSTALFAQQQPRRAPSVQNSPCTPALAACPVQNSPSTPALAACPVQNSPSTPALAACAV